MLVEAAPPVVSFTFGLPDPAAAAALSARGLRARPDRHLGRRGPAVAVEAGMDALIVQSPDAGGHWGTFTPARPPERLRLPELVRAVRAATDLPIMAVGGIGASADVAAALDAGAQAVAVGTLLLLADRGRHQPGPPGRLRRDRGDPVTTQRVLRPPGRRRCPTPSSRRTTAAARSATRPCTT